MKKLYAITILLAIMSACQAPGDNGELTGVMNRPNYTNQQPYGMLFIPMGSLNIGPIDQDVPWAMNSQVKTVSVTPFWIDETEITNNEYRQFVQWVRDSIARLILANAGLTHPDYDGGEENAYFYMVDKDGNPVKDADGAYLLNWDIPIPWNSNDDRMVDINNELDVMFLQKEERFFRQKEIDSRLLLYKFYWIDFVQASRKKNRYQYKLDIFKSDPNMPVQPQNTVYDGEVYDIVKGGREKIKDRSSFIMKDRVSIYPDTLAWVADFSYSYNEPMAKTYFWHPAYDHYPVVGVNWKQANAFSVWRSRYLNAWLRDNGQWAVHDYRLPHEAEWEYAARGGIDQAKYPWGARYTRNKSGCFLANFKPMRGNYTDDGGIYTIEVATYSCNDWGVYDMAGNVAEWTLNAYDESSYSFNHDLNPDYRYHVKPGDKEVRARKVIRGGSWKDVGYYLQTGVRTYEYQDSAKSYIGFRCVRDFLGRDMNSGSGSEIY